jgi:hypothetical protein
LTSFSKWKKWSLFAPVVHRETNIDGKSKGKEKKFSTGSNWQP